jgi:hypothetical protein
MAMLFANNGGAETLGSVSTFTPPTNMSVMFWINETSLALLQQRIFGSDNNYEARFTTDQPAGTIEGDFGGPDTIANITLITAGTWFHVAMAAIFGAGAGSGDNRIYIDGVLDVSNTDATGGAPGAATLTIGNRTGVASGEGLRGTLDDFRIYNRILSDEEIATIYAARGHDAIVDGLVSRVFFNEGPSGGAPSGTGVVKDISGTKNNFTPTGSPLFSSSQLSRRRRVG